MKKQSKLVNLLEVYLPGVSPKDLDDADISAIVGLADLWELAPAIARKIEKPLMEGLKAKYASVLKAPSNIVTHALNAPYTPYPNPKEEHET